MINIWFNFIFLGNVNWLLSVLCGYFLENKIEIYGSIVFKEGGGVFFFYFSFEYYNEYYNYISF